MSYKVYARSPEPGYGLEELLKEWAEESGGQLVQLVWYPSVWTAVFEVTDYTPKHMAPAGAKPLASRPLSVQETAKRWVERAGGKWG